MRLRQRGRNCSRKWNLIGLNDLTKMWKSPRNSKKQESCICLVQTWITWSNNEVTDCWSPPDNQDTISAPVWTRDSLHSEPTEPESVSCPLPSTQSSRRANTGSFTVQRVITLSYLKFRSSFFISHYTLMSWLSCQQALGMLSSCSLHFSIFLRVKQDVRPSRCF